MSRPPLSPRSPYAAGPNLSLALDPPDDLRKRNRSSLPLSDAERFKNVYRADPSRPLFAASMTNLPRFSRDSSRDSTSPHLQPPPSRSASQDASDDSGMAEGGVGDAGDSTGANDVYERCESRYERYDDAPRYEPLRASSAAHARVQRNLQRAAMNAHARTHAHSSLSLSVVPEFEEERNHRVFAQSRVGRWMRRLVRSKD
ncbi:hypothetical protein CspeluHIS016_0801600 [Cutaneotrichosporon spelunceum]|uniref:Uncharacterized protein n=1 Tax=Cutaneotrichosporon spelunceum TaxID=1672016 RepID=A0AAD3TZR9_9TREE|nr:hypothetical protein CspeluHIS016_0801600 [Cutaneotrichosporon spelunceum]